MTNFTKMQRVYYEDRKLWESLVAINALGQNSFPLSFFFPVIKTCHWLYLLCEFNAASPSTNIYRTPECPSTPIAVVAVAISVCPALCIINCLIGALLHRVLVSRSCYRKKQTPTDQPQHLYDEVTLRATGTEIPGSDPSGNRMCDEKIVTLQNQAYAIASV